MSQALRVALWVPSVVPGGIGDGIKTINDPQAGGSIPTAFDVFGGGAGGGISDAPTDGKIYGRQNGIWVENPGAVIDGGTF
jgi:hypothetical protein